MKTTVTITPPIADVLNRSFIDGNTLKLPEQLDRKTYEAVNKVLELAGGRWQKKTRVHVFPSDPRPFLGLAAAQGTITAAKLPVCDMVTPKGRYVVSADQLFPTPDTLADRMIRIADIHPSHDVLEPSGGTGALIAAFHRVQHVRALAGAIPLGGTGRLFVVEKDHALAQHLKDWEGNDVAQGDFMQYEPETNLPFVDRIVMNPPFAGGCDISHIQHAFRFLKPGARLVALCADGPRQQAKLRPWVEALEGTWRKLPAGSFKASGTNVSVALIVIDLVPGGAIPE